MEGSLDPSASVPLEDTIKALLDYLVSPLLPLRDFKDEKPTKAQQEMVGKQMHAVVILYNYYHRRHFPKLEFLDLESFCKTCCITKPGLLNYMRYMHIFKGDYKNLNEHLSITEKMVRDACNICIGLNPSKKFPNTEGWPVSKVAVFLVDLTKENCVLQFCSITQGVWSLVENFLEVCHEKRGERELMNSYAFDKLSSNSSRQNEFEEALDQLAFSAVEQETGIHHSDLCVLERHSTYSLSQEKTTTRLYIMQYERRVSNEVIVLPIKGVIRSLEGPIIKKGLSEDQELTSVVEHYNLLPYYDIISNWLFRRNADMDWLQMPRQQVINNMKCIVEPNGLTPIIEESASNERKVDEDTKLSKSGSSTMIMSITETPSAYNSSSQADSKSESRTGSPCLEPGKQTTMNDQAVVDNFLQKGKSASNERKVDSADSEPSISRSRAMKMSMSMPSVNEPSTAGRVSENITGNTCLEPHRQVTDDHQAMHSNPLQNVNVNDNSASTERKVDKESCKLVITGSQTSERSIAGIPSGNGSSTAARISESITDNLCIRPDRQVMDDHQATHGNPLQKVEVNDNSATTERKVDKESCKPVKSGGQTTMKDQVIIDNSLQKGKSASNKRMVDSAGSEPSISESHAIKMSMNEMPSVNGSSTAGRISENTTVNLCLKPHRQVMDYHQATDSNPLQKVEVDINSASTERKLDKESCEPVRAGGQAIETSIAGIPSGKGSSVAARISENIAGNLCLKPHIQVMDDHQATHGNPLQKAEVNDNSASTERKVDKESCEPLRIGGQTTEKSIAGIFSGNGSSVAARISENKTDNPFFEPERHTIMNNQVMNDKSLQKVELNDKSASNESNVEKESCKLIKTESPTTKQSRLKYAITYSRKVARTLQASNYCKIVDSKRCFVSERMPSEEDHDIRKVSKLNEQNLNNKSFRMVQDEHGTTENCINPSSNGSRCAVNILDNRADISQLKPENLITMKGQSENDDSSQNGQSKHILRINGSNTENVTTCNEKVRTSMSGLPGACRSESLSLTHIPQHSQRGDFSGRNSASDNYISNGKIAMHNGLSIYADDPKDKAGLLDSSKKACVIKSKVEGMGHVSHPNQDGFTSEDLPLVPVLHSSNVRSTFYHAMTSKKNELQQASLLAHQKKLEKLHQQQRLLEDEIAFCEMNIRTISSGEENLPAKIDSVIEALTSIYSNEVQITTYQSSQEQSTSQATKRRKLSEAVLTSRNPCKELDEICYRNSWMLPRYSVLPSFLDSRFTGKFEANLTVQGVDFECSCRGDLKSSPDEARESAAERMLSKLRTMVGQ